MSLRKVFEGHSGRYILKIDHFFDVYEKHFSRFRNTRMRILEIGINEGGSMLLWRNYFGADCEIHGLDINPNARNVVADDVFVHIGSQDDEEFLLSIVRQHGPFDIVIDDGSHFMDHQIRSFETLYPTMTERGVYVCEDAFTSYWREYSGKVGGANTFIEYAKGLVDELHAYWATDDNMEPTPFTNSTEGIYFYSGAVVFERAPVEPPKCVARHKDIVNVSRISELREKEVKRMERESRNDRTLMRRLRSRLRRLLKRSPG